MGTFLHAVASVTPGWSTGAGVAVSTAANGQISAAEPVAGGSPVVGSGSDDGGSLVSGGLLV